MKMSNIKKNLDYQILFEDNHLIAINKNPSEIVQGDKTGDTPLNQLLKEYIKKKYNKPGNVFLGVVHRIDRPTSGVVIFAKTSKALRRLNQLFKEKKINKTYWGIVKNKPPNQTGIVTHYLKKNQKQNKSYVVKNGLKSTLEYKVIKKLNHYFLLEINPKTGRHHQIRAQLSDLGFPIKGDLKYGFSRSNKNASIHLHARKIEFIHPVTNKRIEIVAPTPKKDKIWIDCSK